MNETKYSKSLDKAIYYETTFRNNFKIHNWNTRNTHYIYLRRTLSFQQITKKYKKSKIAKCIKKKFQWTTDISSYFINFDQMPFC